MSKTALYRHYDANGCLLYIGIARRVVQRTADHEKSSGWAEAIARIDVEWHSSREAALKAEAVAIAEEKPKHNRVHNSQSPVAGVAAQLGQKQIALALGVGATAVNNAVVRGVFPATWFPVIRKLCADEGIECPETAFNFKLPSHRHFDTPQSRGAGSMETSA